MQKSEIFMQRIARTFFTIVMKLISSLTNYFVHLRFDGLCSFLSFRDFEENRVTWFNLLFSLPQTSPQHRRRWSFVTSKCEIQIALRSTKWMQKRRCSLILQGCHVTFKHTLLSTLKTWDEKKAENTQKKNFVVKKNKTTTARKSIGRLGREN